MLKYYDGETVVKAFTETTNQSATWARGVLSRTEEADVAPVVHAHWIKVQWVKDESYQEGGWWISRCSHCIMPYNEETRCCPHCGAKMDEVSGRSTSGKTSTNANVDNKTICAVCRDHVTYHTHAIKKTIKINDQPIEYEEVGAFCDICGNEVWVSELDDINAEAPINAYKEFVKNNKEVESK